MIEEWLNYLGRELISDEASSNIRELSIELFRVQFFFHAFVLDFSLDLLFFYGTLCLLLDNLIALLFHHFRKETLVFSQVILG